MMAIRVVLMLVVIAIAPRPVLADANADLFRAAETGTAADVKAALSAGANVNTREENGGTPLHVAAAFNDATVVAALLDAGAGANLNARVAKTTDVFKEEIRTGWAPLHAATKFNDAAVVTLLLDAGADPNARDGFVWTPLHVAAAFNDATVVMVLLDAGADMNARTAIDQYPGEQTPLHVAARFNGVAVVTALLEAGANPSARDQYGATPFRWAAENEALKGSKVYWRLNDARFR